ncbi:MAG: NAD(P)/FAD-dependent oxidoreductase [Rhodobacteraceae bacterium]|nr:NAD(P)/FAD-dependent oxidoreductase [Paracoccaceae bacterium]
MERYDADAVVIGAGVVGLAIAAALARQGREVVILEKNDAFGAETSSRNSEVIHAGIYYEPGSLKGRFCIEGRDRLYAWCAERGVQAHRCGKLVVATDEGELPGLEKVAAKAAGNDMTDLEAIDGAAARAMEPNLNAIAALWSPTTGIIDSHGLMASLLGEAEDHGAALALNAPIEGGETLTDGRITLHVGGGAPCILTTPVVVNAAGMWARDVALSIAGVPNQAVPSRVLTKGNYYALTGKAPFSTLIYPVPTPGSLGVHLTLDLGGAARFGPDVETLDHNDPARLDYSVDLARADSFYAAIRRYWSALPDDSLRADYAGVRPKIDVDYAADFRIDGPEIHGVPGLINLFGIESPGLTGCLAIGDHVAGMAQRGGAAA